MFYPVTIWKKYPDVTPDLHTFREVNGSSNNNKKNIEVEWNGPETVGCS